MDSARVSTRLYPSYSLAQLEIFVAAAGADANPKMVAEIAARKAGTSRCFLTPQIEGSSTITRIGRL